MVRSTFTFSIAGLLVVACGSAPGTESTDSTGQAVSASSVHGDVSTAPAPVAECDGPLPDICERCSDGSEQCAHWVIENGKCEVQICPPASTCPAGQKTCQVEGPNGECKDVCVIDTALCVAPPSCKPVCDPVGSPPEPACTWSTSACKWECPVCDPPGPGPQGCTWSTTACDWICAVTGGSGSGSAEPVATGG